MGVKLVCYTDGIPETFFVCGKKYMQNYTAADDALFQAKHCKPVLQIYILYAAESWG